MSDDFLNDAESSQRDAIDKRRKQELDDIAVLLNSYPGKRLFRRILAEGGVLRLSYVASTTDTAFNEGARNLALKFLADALQVVPGVVASLLIDEHDIAE